jgi:DNA-binding MarR family transcriptional regulator
VTKLHGTALSPRTAGTKPERDFHYALEQWGINDSKSAERLRRLAASAHPSNLDRSLRALGIELFRSLGASTRLFEVIADHHLQTAGLSAPRFRLLVWLHVEEMRGNTQGLSPSRLSHFQNVTKNTVSSLLASLEEQGLIERALSHEDKRQFNIRLSQAGRELICSILPKHSSFMAETLSGLTLHDQATLVALLHKLQLLLLDKASHEGIEHHKPKGV